MFEPCGDDEVWKNHHSQELIEWKLYDSCGVHSLMPGEVSIHMLVEKKYPLPWDTLRRMPQWNIHVNYNVTEMSYEIFRLKEKCTKGLMLMVEVLVLLVVAAAKLPILNPNKFDLWKMRIEQYFLMTDYSLWEVILNGDSPTPTKIVDGVVQSIAPTTAEQWLDKKNELKARGTFLMALLDKHKLKFNIHKDAKTLMEAIKKRFGGNKETKKILGETISQEDINLKFLRNYSLWEVILNGDSPTPTKIVDGVVQSIAPTTAEQWLDKKNELKARGTFLMALLDKHKLKFNIHKDAKTLMEAIKKSTNESVSVVPSISAASSKAIVSTLPNVDSLSDAVIYSFFTSANGTYTIGFDMSKVECYNFRRRGHSARECRSPRDNRNKDTLKRTVPVEVSTSNALVSQCDAVGGYDWSFQAYEEPTNYALMAYSSSESVEARLVVYQQNESVFEDDIKLLKLDVMLRDNALAELRKKFEKAKTKRDELRLTLDKFQTSSKNLSKLLKSQVYDKTGLGYDSQVFDRELSDCEELHSDESVNSVPKSSENDRYKTCKGNHVVPPPYTRTFMPPKPDLVFNDAPNASESVANKTSDFEDETEIELVPKQKEPSFVRTFEHVKTPREYVKKVDPNKQVEHLRTNHQKSRGPKKNLNKKACFVCRSLNNLIKDCNYYEKQMTCHTAVPQSTVKSPRPVKHVVNKEHSPIKRPINHRPTTKTSNFNKKVTTVKVNTVNAVQGIKGYAEKASTNWVWKPKCKVLDPVSRLTSAAITLKQFDYTDALGRSNVCSRHMTRNISFLSDFEEINGGYVSFGGNPKGGKITGKDTECVILSFDYKLPDEKHVLLRVPRENNMYNVDLKNVVPYGDLTCLFLKATLDESNLWNKRIGHINFKTMNKLVKGNLVRGLPSKIFKNNHTCVACQKGKQHRAFWIGPKWLFDIDTLSMSMNYQPVVVGNQPNDNAGIQENLNAGKVRKETTSAQQYVLLPLWSTSYQDPQNTDADVADDAFDVKENKKDVHISPKFSINNTNKVNAVSALVIAAGPNPTNNTNTASPSVNVVSLNFGITGKSSFVHPSKYPDDPDMLELEDIVYSMMKKMLVQKLTYLI
nr:hypothetical protein [Tanacetum cinerariifolium]